MTINAAQVKFEELIQIITKAKAGLEVFNLYSEAIKYDEEAQKLEENDPKKQELEQKALNTLAAAEAPSIAWSEMPAPLNILEYSLLQLFKDVNKLFKQKEAFYTAEDENSEQIAQEINAREADLQKLKNYIEYVVNKGKCIIEALEQNDYTVSVVQEATVNENILYNSYQESSALNITDKSLIESYKKQIDLLTMIDNSNELALERIKTCVNNFSMKTVLDDDFKVILANKKNEMKDGLEQYKKLSCQLYYDTVDLSGATIDLAIKEYCNPSEEAVILGEGANLSL
jgi:hypothetical protein